MDLELVLAHVAGRHAAGHLDGLLFLLVLLQDDFWHLAVQQVQQVTTLFTVIHTIYSHLSHLLHHGAMNYIYKPNQSKTLNQIAKWYCLSVKKQSKHFIFKDTYTHTLRKS